MPPTDSNGLWVLVPERKTETHRDEIREHGLVTALPEKARAVTRELVGDVQESWAEVTRQIGSMLQATAPVEGYELTSVTVKLGMDGKGSIGVVSAGVSAGFEITFQRSQKAP